MNLNF